MAGQAFASVLVDAAAPAADPPANPPAAIHYVPCPPDEAGAPVKARVVHRISRKPAAVRPHVAAHRSHRRHRRRHHLHRRHKLRAKTSIVRHGPSNVAPAPVATRCKVIEREPVSPKTLTSFVSPPEPTPPDAVAAPPADVPLVALTPPQQTADEEGPGPVFPGVPDGLFGGPSGVAPSTPPSGEGPSPPVGQVSGVPEPSAWALMSVGVFAVGLALRIRRRRLLAD